jgi:hypothetical protein
MGRNNRKFKGVGKGMSSGLAISLALHGLIVFLAGIFVVFNVVKKEETVFVPPEVIERPKMRLKKPKVKVKKNTRPKRANRIVSTPKRAVMPDIVLPDISGLGGGLGGGFTGIELMPDLDVSLFGTEQTTGGDFVGHFYDFKRTRSGNTKPLDQDGFQEAVGRFVRSGFKESTISQYYKSPQKLYTTTFCIPPLKSSAAPLAFGEPDDTGGWTWIAHYKGQLIYPEPITFRFWGSADDILVVRVDGEVVLNASYPNTEAIYTPKWTPNDSQSRQYKLGNTTAVVGDWITLEPGVPLDMEVVLGESPGGNFDAMLLVEEKGVEYERGWQGRPILPIFKADVLSHGQMDNIYEYLTPGEASLTNGPIFSAFASVSATNKLELAQDPAESEQRAQQFSRMRIWNNDGYELEAEFMQLMGADTALMKRPNGKVVRVPLARLSEEDREFIELESVPEFRIEFVRKSRTRHLPTTTVPTSWTEDPAQVNNWQYGVRLKQKGSVPYNHELEVEMFAFGQQVRSGGKIVILDRQTTTFTPSAENDYSHSFMSDREAAFVNYFLNDNKFGRKNMGHLIVVRDKRGKIVQYDTSNDWLFEAYDEISKHPAGSFIEAKTGERTHPVGPTRNY